MKSKFIEGLGLMYFEEDVIQLRNKLRSLEDTINSQRDQLFHQDAHISELHDWIKSDSVCMLLRYGSKSPSSSGVDDCEDDHYSDLYNLSVSLRKADREANEARKDDFDQRFP